VFLLIISIYIPFTQLAAIDNKDRILPDNHQKVNSKRLFGLPESQKEAKNYNTFPGGFIKKLDFTPLI